VGLSGKLVVTRTRICTKGNGTITILRTKGWFFHLCRLVFDTCWKLEQDPDWW
jgi:hypothetical protein